MIAITKDEAKALRERFKDVHIVRTCKQKSKRHHYFVVEDRGVGSFIKRMRGERR